MVLERFVKTIYWILGYIFLIFAVLLEIGWFNVEGYIFLLPIIGIVFFIWWKQGKLTKANTSELVFIWAILLSLPIIAEFKPNLLLWVKKHIVVILLGCCIGAAILGICYVFKYEPMGIKAERGSFKYFMRRFILPLAFFIMSFAFLRDIGRITRQTWLENICLVGTEIALMGIILLFILRKLGKIPQR